MDRTLDMDSEFLCCERVHKDIFEKAEKRGRREGAIAELKLIIKRNSNFKYSRLDMIEFCEKRLKKLQGGGE